MDVITQKKKILKDLHIQQMTVNTRRLKFDIIYIFYNRDSEV